MAAASGTRRAARRERRRRIGYVLYRWFLVLVGSIGVGWLVHGILARGASVPIQLPTTGIAIVAACAFAGDLMSLITACGVYIRGEVAGPGHMLSGFWKAWGTASTLFLAFFSYVVPIGGDSQITAADWAAPAVAAGSPVAVAPRLGEPWLVVYSTQPPPPMPRPRLSTVPVFYRNNAAPDSAERSGARTVAGVSFAKDELDVSIDGLHRIVAALAACGAVPGGPPTELEVAGYAGSQEFVVPQGATQADTDRRGAHIANRRARAAYCYVASLTPVRLANAQDWDGYQDGPECALDKAPSYRADLSPLQITVHRWDESEAGWQQMLGARRFVDRPPGVAQAMYSDPEELNRRVDISVLSAGSCSAAAAPNPSVDTPVTRPAPITGDGPGRIAQTEASEPGSEAPPGG